MGSFSDFVTSIRENLLGKVDWQVKKSGASVTFNGYFLVYDKSARIKIRVPGQVVEWRGLPAQVYLYNPPSFIKKHQHGACFQLLRPNDKWFKLHFVKPARDFQSARIYVERLLAEAYNLSG